MTQVLPARVASLATPIVIPSAGFQRNGFMKALYRK